jgi:predicted O-methyltransferase YrrM
MDLEAFQAALPGLFGGDLRADHPVDRRFRAVVADVPGMATEHKLALLNLAAAHLEPGEAYLEVGSFKGLSLIGAMLGNAGRRFAGIESFLEFNSDGRARADLEANLARWVEPGRARLLEGDCFDLLRSGVGLEEPVGVYFYDGAHGRLPQYLALGVAEPWLADRALVVIDDASWPIVARATDRYVAAHPGYRLLFDLAAEREEDPRWWNGVRVYAFERPRAQARAQASVGGGSAGGVRGTPEGCPGRSGRLLPPRSIRVAWRLLAYDLVYRPAARVAWRTLPRHPGLRAAVLRVVPLASRRVPVRDGSG